MVTPTQTPPPTLISRDALPFTGATIDATVRFVRAPVRQQIAELNVVLRPMGIVLVVETRRDDGGREVPGLGGHADPVHVPEAVSRCYGHIRGCRSDPMIASMLSDARSRCAAAAATGGNAPMPVYFPVPSALRPALETTRPQAPSVEPDKKNNAALDKPKEQRGASIKEDKEAARAPEKPQVQRDDALNPGRRVALPDGADGKTATLHERYVQVRSELENASFKLMERDPARAQEPAREATREPARDSGRTLEHKLVDQTLRLDSASREFFSKPGWQREAGFQRALVLSLFATGVPLEQAMKELASLFSGRGLVDVEQLSKLTSAYGLNELSSVLGETKLSPEVAAQRDAERLAQLQKLKGGRLPEEMLLQQQQARDVTGKKKKDGTADDRIDGIERDHKREREEQEREEEEEELIADDEPTNPGFVLKIESGG